MKGSIKYTHLSKSLLKPFWIHHTNVMSTKAELADRLRWTAIASAAIPQLDYAISGGVHCGKGVIKSILAGATAVEVCSAIYQYGPKEIESMKKEFDRLGVHPGNTYMFIQGHHIMDNVVLRLLIPVCTVLRREREQQIHDLALHDMQLHNELTSYQRSQVGVEVVIHRNSFYKNSPLYQMIRRDIEKFLKIIR